MKKLFLYIMAASRDPDNVTCPVPFRIDDKEVFFGPCKDRIREKLRKDYLLGGKNSNNDIYLVGANGANRDRVRKIIFVGKVRRVMTFERAYNQLNGRKYKTMRAQSNSPLHVSPVYKNGKLHGYEHVSELHSEHNGWMRDLIKNENYTIEGNVICSANFDRDCCMLLDNIFFADGTKMYSDKCVSGLQFSDSPNLLKMLKNKQPDRNNVDEFAIFGVNCKGNVDGRTGGSLNFQDEEVDAFLEEVEKLKEKNRGSRN